MKPTLRDLHIQITEEELKEIKMEAARLGISMKDFIVSCCNEVIIENKKYQ